MNLAWILTGEETGFAKLSTFFPPTRSFFGLREYRNRTLNVKKKVCDEKKIFK